MSPVSVLVRRLECVEKEVLQLKQRLDQIAPQENWLDKIIGSMEGLPHLPEVADFEAEGHPLAPFAGMLRDDPMLDAWKQAMAENRRKLDKAEGLP